MFKKLFGKIFGVQEITTIYRSEATYDEDLGEMGDFSKGGPFKAYFNISTRNDRIFEVTGRKFDRMINARKGNDLSEWNNILEDIRNNPSKDYKILKSFKIKGNDAFDVKSRWENEKLRFIVNNEVVIKYLNYDFTNDIYRKAYIHAS